MKKYYSIGMKLQKNMIPLKMDRVQYTTLGSDPVSDVIVYTEKDSRFCVDITSTKDGKFITMPDLIVDYDMSRRSFSIVHQEEVLGISSQARNNEAHEWMNISDAYFCERKEVLSEDGTIVPLTILYSHKAHKMGQSPGILHGYGSYGEALDKNWCAERLSLLDRDYLIKEGYVHKDQLAAVGHSAGGLLVGAAINMHPKLFRAAILKTNMSGGHFGEGGRSGQCEELAYEYAFLMKVYEMNRREKAYVADTGP
ncbi:hypothetical protein Ccrd_000729 [Cynara cardunculus var. scolymus]|uniref:Prolyl endopeptidase-like n=1 Tax=Cynara cardunculus var. scolymus TaxID=59895 RepID=A0A103XUL7_CYNCS|nr:hypothetical protein Ccrd_000729 [Cynara cardunculus var. scolymus]